MRSRKKPWAARELEENGGIIKNPEAYKGQWHTLFQNDNPIHIEIGCGKGRFINEQARRDKTVNYIALEREEQIIAVAAREARETGNAGIAFIIGDAKNLPAYFAPGELRRIYINFCDPWHRRKKWAKRRLTHRDFLALYESLLLGGELFFKTDNPHLFEFSLNEFADTGWRFRNIALNLHQSAYCPPNPIMTEYEEKFAALGLPIYRLEAMKPIATG